MAWTTPRTWTTGEVVTAAMLNEQIRDNLNFLNGTHGVRAYRSSTVSIADATFTTISFANESYDTDLYHDNATNPSRLTVPSGLAGVHLITSLATYAGSASASQNRRTRYLKNGSNGSEAYYVGIGNATVDDKNNCTEVLNLIAGDYMEMQVRHNHGSNLNIQAGESVTWFAATRIAA